MRMGQGAAWKADMHMVLWGEGCTTGPLLLNSLTPAHRGNVWHSRVWHRNADVLPLFHFRAISLLTLNLDMDDNKAFQVRDLEFYLLYLLLQVNSSNVSSEWQDQLHENTSQRTTW